MEAIERLLAAWMNLTGLPPSALFAIVAVLLTILQAVVRRSKHAAGPVPRVARKKSEFLGELSPEELAKFDGSDSSKPILLAIKGDIFDVTRAKDFYGPGGPYGVFSGKDAARALAKMSTDPKDVSPDISDLSMSEKETLDGWELTFRAKYDVVGTVSYGERIGGTMAAEAVSSN